ncbi:hypothetical protein YC2023_089526 [Brassica napus]
MIDYNCKTNKTGWSSSSLYFLVLLHHRRRTSATFERKPSRFVFSFAAKSSEQLPHPRRSLNLNQVQLRFVFSFAMNKHGQASSSTSCSVTDPPRAVTIIKEEARSMCLL